MNSTRSLSFSGQTMNELIYTSYFREHICFANWSCNETFHHGGVEREARTISRSSSEFGLLSFNAAISLEQYSLATPCRKAIRPYKIMCPYKCQPIVITFKGLESSQFNFPLTIGSGEFHTKLNKVTSIKNDFGKIVDGCIPAPPWMDFSPWLLCIQLGRYPLGTGGLYFLSNKWEQWHSEGFYVFPLHLCQAGFLQRRPSQQATVRHYGFFIMYYLLNANRGCYWWSHCLLSFQGFENCSIVLNTLLHPFQTQGLAQHHSIIRGVHWDRNTLVLHQRLINNLLFGHARLEYCRLQDIIFPTKACFALSDFHLWISLSSPTLPLIIQI